MYLGFHARVMTEASATVCLILATAVKPRSLPVYSRSICRLKKLVDTRYLARVM